MPVNKKPRESSTFLLPVTSTSHLSTLEQQRRDEETMQLKKALEASKKESYRRRPQDSNNQEQEVPDDQVAALFDKSVSADYSLDKCKTMISSVVLDVFNAESLEDVESVNGGWVRGANSKMEPSDSKCQGKAQYGRILFDATQRLLDDVLRLDHDTGDVFVDVGHGIGNAVFQAAYVNKCEARGIEVVESRNVIAVAFADSLAGLRKRHLAEKDIDYQIGSVKLVRGGMETRAHRDFLTAAPPGKAIKAFCNNYNAVFSDRSAKVRTTIHLDDILAGLFAQMPVGSVLATFHQLNMMPDRQTTESSRRVHQLPQDTSGDDSFYNREELSLGKERDCVSWSSNDKELIVYKYTRLAQASDDPVFLCSNPDCDRARRGEAIPATKIVEADYTKEEVHVMNSCGCNAIGAMSRRRRDKAVNYAEMD